MQLVSRPIAAYAVPMKYWATLPIPDGAVGLVATDRGLCHVLLTAQDQAGAASLLLRRYPEARPDPFALSDVQEQLQDYFAGQPVDFRIRCDLAGLTPFQRLVLEACARIGYGDTVTYGQLARRVGRPGAARAVGAVMARNPIPIVIPCHRVVAGDGSMGGYSAEQGVAMKRRLLDMEAACGTGHGGTGLPPARSRGTGIACQT